MKFVTKFLNLLLFCFTFCLMTVAEWGVFNLLALPTGTSNTIGFVSADKNNDGIDENVAYIDTYTFLGEDLVQSVTREPRYLVRSWFGWDWWQKGMKWADYAVEFVVGATVPIFAPMYEVSQVKYFYADQFELAKTGSDARTTLDWFSADSTNALTVYGMYDVDQEPVLDPLFDDLIKKYEAEHSNSSFYQYRTITAEKPTEADYAANNFNVAFEKYYKEHTSKYNNAFIFKSSGIACSGSIYKISNNSLTKITECNGVPVETNEDGTPKKSIVGSQWFHDNSGFMNMIYKINKYNERKPAEVTIDGEVIKMDFTTYDNWANKFMVDGQIKSSVIALYFQFFMALILSIWFVCQNPLKINRNDYGENEISGGYRTGKHKKREKKEKKKKE